MDKALALFLFLLVLVIYRASASSKQFAKAERNTGAILLDARPCIDFAAEAFVDGRDMEDIDHKLATWVLGNADTYLSDPDDVEMIETWKQRAELLHFRYIDGNMRDPFALKVSRDFELEREHEFRNAA